MRSQWGRSEVVIIYPEWWTNRNGEEWRRMKNNGEEWMLLIQTWIQTSRSFSTLWRSCDMQKFQVGCYETVKDRSISNALPSQSPKTQVIYGNLWIWVFHLFTPVQSSKKPRFWEPFTNCRSPLWTWQLQETSCSARKHCINQGLESLTLQTLQAQNVPKSETLCKFYANSMQILS